MVKLHEMNSRMKDFYDIWLLSRQFDFVGEKLAEAIRLTFNRRGTTLPNEIVSFTERFIAAKQIQWKTFTLKLNQEYVPTSFAHIVSVVESFLGPFATAISSGTTVPTIWIAPGPWSKKGRLRYTGILCCGNKEEHRVAFSGYHHKTAAYS